jgi:hypothetical protein
MYNGWISISVQDLLKQKYNTELELKNQFVYIVVGRYREDWDPSHLEILVQAPAIA